MPQGIFIPADDREAIDIRFYDGLADYQRSVDGNIEAIDIDRPEASFFVNEKAKLIDLGVNWRATLLLWVHNSRYRGLDGIRGNAGLIGRPDEDGYTQSVPSDLLRLLFNTSEYKYEVNAIDDEHAWKGNAVRYADWTEAYRAGLSLAERWFAVNHVRVVPA